jgi:hypothetical protein
MRRALVITSAAVVGLLSLLGARAAEASCSPACGLGYNCVNGSCDEQHLLQLGGGYTAPPDLVPFHSGFDRSP